MNDHAEAHGTIFRVDTADHPHDRPLALWLVRRQSSTPNFEAIPYHYDGEQRDWFPSERTKRFIFESQYTVVRLLATSRGLAIRLVPAGLVHLGNEDQGGEWMGSPELVGRAAGGRAA